MTHMFADLTFANNWVWWWRPLLVLSTLILKWVSIQIISISTDYLTVRSVWSKSFLTFPIVILAIIIHRRQLVTVRILKSNSHNSRDKQLYSWKKTFKRV